MSPPRVLQLLRLVLRFEQGASLHFSHGPALYAWVMDRLGAPPRWPVGVAIQAVETGRVTVRAGERYHLGLALGEAAPPAPELLRLLAGGPRTPAGRRPGAPFGGGVRLVEVSDLVADAPLAVGATPRWLTRDELRRAAKALVGQTRLSILLTSPLQILRTPVDRGDTVMDDEVFLPEVFVRRALEGAARWFPWCAGAEVPRVTLEGTSLGRVDTCYAIRDAQGSTRDAAGGGGAARKWLPGVRGRVVLGFPDGVTEALAEALLLAGVVGVPKSTNQGQGRFSVDDTPLVPSWPPAPAMTWLQRCAARANFDAAWDDLRRAGAAPGVDDVTVESFLDTLPHRIESLRIALAEGTIAPKPLRGILLRRPNGRVRGLAVPTVEDRFLQRAVMEELAPAIDRLLEDDTYAYRKGLSRRHAEVALRRGRDEGYGFVLDADLRAFFDSVDWTRLEAQLRACLLDDPLVALLLDWCRAPVEHRGERIPRDAGLPQGAVVSPVLANLFLDTFDKAMARRGHRVVRYADDFVVLARTREQAEAAHEAAAAEARRLGLELAADKTRVTSFDEGFRFLGYLFVKGLVMPAEKPREGSSVLREEELADALAEGEVDAAALRGWAARAFASEARGEAEEEAPREARWLGRLAQVSADRRPVYVVAPGLRVTSSRHALRVWKESERIAEVAWNRVSEVVLVGRHILDAGFFEHALRAKVPVALHHRNGEPAGLLLPDRVRAPTSLSLAQWRWAEDRDRRMAVARELVEAKVHNQRLVAKHQPGDNTAARERMASLANAALRAETPDRLRGLEGMAAHSYFARWGEWVGPTFRFERRSTRGATDPVNATLNLLYTQLFRLCWMSALAAGLDPYLGFLHEGRDRYAALAADLMEPFRFLCERLTLELIHRKSLTPDDFATHEKMSPPLLLRPEAAKRVLEAWEKRLATPVRIRDEEKDYRHHVFAQTERFAAVVRGERGSLLPFRLKW